MAMLNIKIVGERLPGRTFCEHANVHIGVQRGDEVVQIQPADQPSVRFAFGIVLRETDDGLDFRSPFVHGKPGDRFFYLSWGDVGGDGTFSMFRRAKLMLSALPPGLVIADRTGTLEGYLSLTDAKGGPLCAAVRPPTINWSSGG